MLNMVRDNQKFVEIGECDSECLDEISFESIDTEQLHEILEDERQQSLIKNANALTHLIKNKDTDEDGKSKL